MPKIIKLFLLICLLTSPLIADECNKISDANSIYKSIMQSSASNLSVKRLQQIVGVTADGMWGPRSDAAYNNLISKCNSYSYPGITINIEGAKIENKVKVGPYARLREGTHLMSGVKIGNFVETKKSKIKKNSKVNHLSYIGDTLIGKNSNIGAGTITCNYDGVKKNKTTISDNVFIGSNSSLVAPLKINKNAVVGAGSVITEDVKENSLSIERSEQEEIENYKRKK